MVKIKGYYNGFKLENGKMYCLSEISINNYKMLEIINENDRYNAENFIETGKTFTRIKEYKEYLKGQE